MQSNDAQRLKDKQHTLSYWNKTKNIYTINFQGYDSSVAEDSLEARNINDELKNFYQKSKDKIKIFLIKTQIIMKRNRMEEEIRGTNLSMLEIKKSKFVHQQEEVFK